MATLLATMLLNTAANTLSKCCRRPTLTRTRSTPSCSRYVASGCIYATVLTVFIQATIHQSLPAHPNIVTLHRTLETPSFLLLLLEFVPGEDLFYFLEQARDHYEVDPLASDLSTTPPSDSSCSSSRTPSSPSLLSSLAPSQLLSRTRLRLIASMFSQMCEAVATCHDNSVFHRDIKPENFIVTDGWTTLPDGRRERKVVVKLTDFGLSTTDTDSADMDCGSAPYMSFGTLIAALSSVSARSSQSYMKNAEITYTLLILPVLPMSGHLVSCLSICTLLAHDAPRGPNMHTFQVVPLQPLDRRRRGGLPIVRGVPPVAGSLLHDSVRWHDRFGRRVPRNERLLSPRRSARQRQANQRTCVWYLGPRPAHAPGW